MALTVNVPEPKTQHSRLLGIQRLAIVTRDPQFASYGVALRR
jgi:hypothetical protein